MNQTLKISLVIAVSIVFLAACGMPNIPAETPTPTVPPLIGDVTIDQPESGSIIYAETMLLSGTASDVPAEGFLLRLTINEETIVESTIQPEDGVWSVQWVHQYTGEPTEATLTALSPNPLVQAEYITSLIVLSSVAHRPEGVFGRLLFPNDEEVLGGDQLEVRGTASGIPDNTLTVVLENSEGIISQQTAIIDNPFFIDEMIWSADLTVTGETGPATIRVYYTDESGEEVLLDEVDIMLSMVAG